MQRPAEKQNGGPEVASGAARIKTQINSVQNACRDPGRMRGRVNQYDTPQRREPDRVSCVGPPFHPQSLPIDHIVLYRGGCVGCRVAWCSVLLRVRPWSPAGLVSMRLCLYRTSRDLIVLYWSLWFRSIGVNEQPLPTPAMRPLSLSPLPPSLCSLFCSAPVYSPSSLPCVHGHWLGFGWRLCGGCRRTGQGGSRSRRGADVLVRAARRRQGKRGGAPHVGRRDRRARRVKVSRPRQGCRAAIVAAAACAVCARVCLVCVCNASRRHLPAHTLAPDEAR